MNEADPKRWTQEVVGALLGVDRSTVTKWFTNVNDHNSKSPPPDARLKLDQACERFGIAYKTAAQAAWVASQFESSSRLEHLTFKHHEVVAGRDDAADLLDAAALTAAGSPPPTGSAGSGSRARLPSARRPRTPR